MKTRRSFLLRLTAILLLAALLPHALADHPHWCEECEKNTSFYVDPETGDDVCSVCGWRIAGVPMGPVVPADDPDPDSDPEETLPEDNPANHRS